MTIREICCRLQSIDCRKSSVHTIVRDILGFRKLTSRWVPRLLNEHHMQQRMGAVLQFLTEYDLEGPSFIDWIVTGDETWVHHMTLESKEQSKASQSTYFFNGDSIFTAWGWSATWTATTGNNCSVFRISNIIFPSSFVTLDRAVDF